MKRRSFLAAAAAMVPLAAAVAACTSRAGEPLKQAPKRFKVEKTPEEWRKILTPEQYDVLRNKGTEPAFSGAYWNEHRAGIFSCAGCKTPVFSSEAKFESGTGWPSFWQPIDKKAVLEVEDRSAGMVRTEVECATCGGHLGHVFEDGPKPTGLRYCIDSAALSFEPKKG